MSEKNEPIFMTLSNDADGYLSAVQSAKDTLHIFKAQIEQLSVDDFACVKFYIPETRESLAGANIWLMNPFFEDGFCYAKPFELPNEFKWIQVGQWLKFSEVDILDWYILYNNGEMLGGYSLRYQRSILSDEGKAEFDQRVGVSKFIDQKW